MHEQEHEMTDAEHTRPTERLWTPWRMGYIGGETRETGCIFCNRLERTSDVESLILHRMDHSFVIMNLYPYNTGHIMLVPNQHASDPAALDADTLSEMGRELPVMTNALRRALGCQGFNVGLNIGAIAGAGVEAHLHQHIVPRWQGDANFMPILASTMTIPELIPVTYAKLRSEMAREITESHNVRFVVFAGADDRILLHNGRIPSVTADPDQPAIQAITSALPDGIRDLHLVGWAGPDSAARTSPDDIAVSLAGNVVENLPEGWSVAPTDASAMTGDDRRIIAQAVAQQAPAR